MSKRLPPSGPSRPPVKLRLPQISLQELKSFKVAIRRKDVSQDIAVTGPLTRSLDDPEDLVLHKPGEGETPIFDRDDVIVNLDFEERIVIDTSETPRSSIPRSEEEQTSNSRNRRSRSHSGQGNTDKQYCSRSRSRSKEKHTSKDDIRNKPTTSFHRSDSNREIRTNKSVVYTDKLETLSNSNSGHGNSMEEKSLSCEREHSNYRSPTRSDTQTYKRDASYRDRPRYSKSQERRSRSPYRDRDAKYGKYTRRTRSPFARERYKSPSRKVRRAHSRSPPKYRVCPEDQRRPLATYQMSPHFGPPWSVYEPMPPYVHFVIPDGYIPAPPHRFPAGIPQRPSMPVRLPFYNSRPSPKPSTNDTTTDTTSENTETENGTPRQNIDSESTITSTQEIVKLKD